MAIANLSSIVKDVVMQSHDQVQQNTHDIVWFNVTMQNYSELYTVIRKLEFAMIYQFDRLLGAIQSVLQGKLPICLINPTTLQGILRNISVHARVEICIYCAFFKFYLCVALRHVMQ